MEATLGVTLFDRSTRTPALTEAGLAIVNDARAVLEGAKAMRAHAESIAADVEPEMTLAVDSMFPTPLLMASLDALRHEFPDLPATVFTEALGGAEQRLRDGAARMAIYTLPGGATRDLSTAVPRPHRADAGGRRRPPARRRPGPARPRGAGARTSSSS